jgi:hypothetical protein
MSYAFKHFLDAQGRTEPVPVSHFVIELDQFLIGSKTGSPIMDLREEFNKITNLEMISWIEDQGWEYEIFLTNEYRLDMQGFQVKMMLMLTKEAATVYLLRWS